jgi:hypothetical protein
MDSDASCTTAYESIGASIEDMRNLKSDQTLLHQGDGIKRERKLYPGHSAGSWT